MDVSGLSHEGVFSENELKSLSNASLSEIWDIVSVGASVKSLEKLSRIERRSNEELCCIGSNHEVDRISLGSRRKKIFQVILSDEK